MRTLTGILLALLAWAVVTTYLFGAVIIPWPRNMAAPGIVFLKPGMPTELMVGALVHELCHVQQFREGRAGGSVTKLELECACEEYFFYERIGYIPGMKQVMHYAIP